MARGLFMRIPIMKTTKGSSVLAVNLPGITWAMSGSSCSWFGGLPARPGLSAPGKPHTGYVNAERPVRGLKPTSGIWAIYRPPLGGPRLGGPPRRPDEHQPEGERRRRLSTKRYPPSRRRDVGGKQGD